MRPLIAIRTHRWTEEEDRLLDALREVPGHDLVVVFHNRPKGFVPPLDVVDLDDAVVSALGLRIVPDYGWRCGDYAFYALRAARPGYSHYWLIEPDVHFVGAASEFFATFLSEEADALGHDIGPVDPDVAFKRGLPGVTHLRALFALTCLSGRAIDKLARLRRDYPGRDIAPRFYVNDEIFVFSHVLADAALSSRSFEDVAPEWFASTQFSPSPDILLEQLDGTGPRIVHPVHGRASFKRALAMRMTARTAYLRQVRDAIRVMEDADIDDIATMAAARLRDELIAWRRGSR